MALKQPESMVECIYFTRRTIGDGKVMAWVFRQTCPQCGKGVMGKPTDDKGKVKVRAKEYVCPECGHTIDKREYEESLTANVSYTCPHCQHKGEAQVPFKRKSIAGVQTLTVQCEKCGGNVDITKKMQAK